MTKTIIKHFLFTRKMDCLYISKNYLNLFGENLLRLIAKAGQCISRDKHFSNAAPTHRYTLLSYTKVFLYGLYDYNNFSTSTHICQIAYTHTFTRLSDIIHFFNQYLMRFQTPSPSLSSILHSPNSYTYTDIRQVIEEASADQSEMIYKRIGMGECKPIVLFASIGLVYCFGLVSLDKVCVIHQNARLRQRNGYFCRVAGLPGDHFDSGCGLRLYRCRLQ